MLDLRQGNLWTSSQSSTHNRYCAITHYSNPPHRQAAISKCLAITPPKTSKPKAKPELKVPKVPTESQRASTRTRKAVDKYGNNVGYDNWNLNYNCKFKVKWIVNSIFKYNIMKL